VAREWDITIDRLRDLSVVDRLGIRVNGNLSREYVAALEIKCRKHKAGTFPTFFIDEEKVNGLLLARKLLGVSPIIVVRWTNVTGWFHADDSAFKRMGGRSDRGDDNDIEMMCHYDIKRARHLTTMPVFYVSA